MEGRGHDGTEREMKTLAAEDLRKPLLSTPLGGPLPQGRAGQAAEDLLGFALGIRS